MDSIVLNQRGKGKWFERRDGSSVETEFGRRAS